jgi:putative glutamine amidotransferase
MVLTNDSRPVIGISCYALQARWGTWDARAILLPERYADMVSAAGGVPVLLPPADGITSLLPRLDGLILSGGSDVDPALYGAAQDPQTGPVYPVRDHAELDLARQALADRLPLLGICRGLQIINVALGGTLHQHLPDLVGHERHSPEQNGYGRHDVKVAPGSQLADILGADHTAVPTHHHQAIDRLGTGLIATGWTDDGVIEATEFSHQAGGGPGHGTRGIAPFMIAVQWHPEVGKDLSLFEALITAAQPARQPANA